MNTQLPILDVVSPQGSARPATQAGLHSADTVSFNQILNKEVSNRNTSSQSKPNDAAQPKNAPANTSAAPDPAARTSSVGSKTKVTSADDQTGDAQNLALVQDQSTTDPAQMLMLVTNLGQTAVQSSDQSSSDSKIVDTDMDVLASQKGGQNGLTMISAEDNGKEMTDDKAVDTPARATVEKQLPESPVSTRAVQANLQDSANVARSSAKTADPEVTVKTVDTAQPNASTVIPALQQAMLLSQQAAITGQAVQRLTPAVGSPGWDQAVGQKLFWMTSGGIQSASLTLNPPDLGPLQVVLRVNNQQADATFITAQPEVRQALEAAMPKLREMMDQAGIQLGQATVDTGTPNQQKEAGQQQAHSSMSPFGGARDDADLNVVMLPVGSGGQRLVDTFA
ncbi:MAG: flagellar hook-length control protein FliK [Herbaspirillum sp.]